MEGGDGENGEASRRCLLMLFLQRRLKMNLLQ